jgi:hypothetical protein
MARRNKGTRITTLLLATSVVLAAGACDGTTSEDEEQVTGIGAGPDEVTSEVSALVGAHLGKNENGDAYGAAAAAGDLDGDKIGDLVVGGPGENGDTGAVFIYFGGSSDFLAYRGIDESDVSSSAQASDQFGKSLAIGDLNKDSYPDIVVGAPGNGGAVYVLWGSKNQQFEVGATKLNVCSGVSGSCSPKAGDAFGFSVAVGRVMPGDSRPTLVVGVPNRDLGSNPNAGMVKTFVWNGAALVLQATIPNPAAAPAHDRFGYALAVGDVPDGFGNLMVGAPSKSSTTKPGAVYRFERTGGAFVKYQTIVAGADAVAGDAFGESLTMTTFTPPGDIFQTAALAVGAPERGGGKGRVRVFLMSASGLGGYPWQVGGSASGTQEGEHFGTNLASSEAASGNYELAVGAPERDGFGKTHIGGVDIFAFGGLSKLASLTSVEPGLTGPASEDKFGSAVVWRDFDGDGTIDLAMGMKHRHTAGAVNVLHRQGGFNQSPIEYFDQESGF